MDDDTRPPFSPYIYPAIPVQFADGRTLYIQPHLLSQSYMLEAKYLDNRLNFPDVSSDVGHVIVHYLLTGSYQSLQPEYSGLIKAFATEFSTSIRAYNAAKAYALPNLAELAKAEVERLGEKLPVSHVFDTLRQICPNPDPDDVWLGEFLKSQLRSFLWVGFIKPPQSQTGTLHKTVPISHVLFKSMLELFRENEVPLREKTHDGFEVAMGDDQGIPAASRYLFVKPAAESNLFVGELEGSLFQAQEIGTSQHGETEKGNGSVGPLNEKEGKEQAAPKTQQQVNREIQQLQKEAGEQTNQDTTKFIEEAAIIEEEATELVELVKARAYSLWGLDNLEDLRLHLLEARAKERAEGQVSRKVEESVEGKGIMDRNGQKMDRDSESNAPGGHSSDHDSAFGTWEKTELDDDGEYLKEEGWSF
ncbi:hypothetical protein J3F84DRAFT_407121 [Trichoderma pleuroticola]